jgi:glutamyl-tRNA synthetase
MVSMEYNNSNIGDQHMNKIRVRFAPSPTGALHIGGARTALFNWLYARKTGGSFILRLEDTDSERSSQESAQGILEGLTWLGIDWDEGPEKGGPYGPYRQSQRLNIYQHYLQELIRSGKAYYCFCGSEDLAKERVTAREQGLDYKYSGRCRDLDEETIRQRLLANQPAVIRMRIPESGTTRVSDLIRGEVGFENRLMDDFIIAKSDGWPTYNFAVVVDDHCMAITHVIRAEEHLSNTPRQVLIYHALGWDLPQFAHVSMILAPDRSKLSKRHGATSVQEFRDLGYLPEALINYLALLGWSSGMDQDLWLVDDIIPRFDLDQVSRSAAVYDMDKLTWMNGQYITKARPESLAAELMHNTRVRQWVDDFGPAYLLKVIELLQSRVKLIPEIVADGAYFFEEVALYEEQGVKKHFCKANTVQLLQADLNIIASDVEFTAATLESSLREAARQSGVKAAELIHPLRLALTGRSSSPGIFEVAVLLGQKTCVSRVQNALRWVKEHAV